MKKKKIKITEDVAISNESKDFHRSRNYLFVLTSFLIVTFCFSSIAFAQDKTFEYPPDAEPPPLKILSKQEKEKLESETKIKSRTKLALELMDSRLIKAEEARDKNEYKELFDQLGAFHAIIDHTLKFLNRRNNDSRKILFNYKRLEIGLRKLLPRIELIRRDVPLKYQYYVKNLLINVRDARSRAVEPLYDDSVISDDDDG